MNRVFVVGDIHGAHKALLQCFERSNFDYENDTLISLGDLCDGWPETKEVIDELLKIKNLIFIYGNHDLWFKNWLLKGEVPALWVSLQGGKSTINSYKNKINEDHITFINKGLFYFEYKNKIFVHGGIDLNVPINKQDSEFLVWDRTLIQIAYNSYLNKKEKISSYDEIYVGHTPTLKWGVNVPLKFCEVILMDTGAGWPGGRLTIMNVETKEKFYSDIVDTLYPGIHGRL